MRSTSEPSSRRSFRGGAFCVLSSTLVVVSPVAGCSGDDQRAESLVAVTVDEGALSPDCPEMCWRKLRVQVPGHLVLEDSEGSEQFDIPSQDFDAIAQIVRGENFERALADPQDCHAFAGAGSVIVVEWEDQPTVSDSGAKSCFGQPDERTHPYGNLYWSLIGLLKRHLDCPSYDPSTEQWSEGGPPVRYLCYGCWSWPSDQACL